MEHVNEECQCKGKKCTKCKELRCVDNYTKDKRLRSGLKSKCRICSSAESKEWRQQNWEYDQLRKRAWEKEHPEQTLVQRRRRNKHNPPLPLKTPEEKKETQHRYNVQFYARDKRANMERSLQWRRKYPDRWCAIQASRRTRKTQSGGSHTAAEWKSLKAQYDYTCLRCGRKEPDIKLCADHVIPVSRGGSSYIDNIQPLCKSCNSIKKAKIIDFRPQNP